MREFFYQPTPVKIVDIKIQEISWNSKNVVGLVVNFSRQKSLMALSSPESPVPQRRIFINRVENPSEEHEELNKMAHGVIAESRR